MPGILSLCRLPLAAAFPFVFRSPVHAVTLLAVAAATDVLDGWYARHFHQQTATGAFIDGVMDKVFALVVVVTLVAGARLTAGEAFALGTREIGEVLLIGVALSLGPRRVIEPARAANATGKLATVLQFATVVAALARSPERWALVWATAAVGAIAALAYGARELSAPAQVAQIHTREIAGRKGG